MTENTIVPEAKKTPWYLTRAAAVWGLLLVGPLALPIVWLTPRFKTRTKVIISVITAIFIYLSYLYTPVLMDTLMKRLDDLQTAAQP